MKIKIYSRGETDIDADPEYQEPAIRSALENAMLAEAASGFVASAVTDLTDTERSDISHDEYAVVTGDDGRELWRGWLGGGQSEPAPDGGDAGELYRAALLIARDALRSIALGTVRDPSVTADMALAGIRQQLGELLPDGWDAR